MSIIIVNLPITSLLIVGVSDWTSIVAVYAHYRYVQSLFKLLIGTSNLILILILGL